MRKLSHPTPPLDVLPLTADEEADLKRAAQRAKALRGHMIVRYTDRGEQLVTVCPEDCFIRTAA